MTSGLISAVLVLATATAMRASIGAGRRSLALRRLPFPLSAEPPRTLVSDPPWVARALGDVGLDVNAQRAWHWSTAGAGLSSLTALLVAGPAAAVALIGAVVVGPWLGWTLFRHRGAELMEDAVPFALDELARSLRSGASMLQALQEVAATGPSRLRADFALMASGAERGQGVVGALESWSERRPLPAVQLAVAALCLGAEAGGAQARAVDGVAATIRLRLGLAGEARALAAQARLSAAVIGLAPIAFGAMAAATDERVGHVLAATPFGWTLIVLGVGLDVLGARWMASLARVVA